MSLPHVVICVARAMRLEQFEVDLFGVVRVCECTARLFSGKAVARSAYFARDDAYKIKSSRG